MAQDQKTGYVDIDYILSQIPEYENIQQQMSSIDPKWKKGTAGHRIEDCYQLFRIVRN